MFSFRCFPSSFRAFANSDFIKVVSESESSMAFTTVVIPPYITATGITCKKVWDLSGFVKSCLFAELTVAYCGLLRCSRV